MVSMHYVTKGQIISKWVSSFRPKNQRINLRIFAQASKKRLNQTLYYNKYVKYSLINIIKCLYFFDLTSFRG